MTMQRSKLRSVMLYGYAAGVYAFLYIPLFIVVLYSFNTSRLFIWPPEGFGLDWYRELWSDEQILRSLKNSLQISSIATVIAAVVGTATAMGLRRLPDRWRRRLQGLFVMPLLVPGMVTGLGLLLFFTSMSVSLSKFTIILGHVAFVTPIVLFVVSSRLRRIGPQLQFAARDLGAGPWRGFYYVTLPLIRTAVIGGALLAFSLSFDEVIITFLLTGTDNTLPMQIFSMLRFGLSPEVNAVYSIILVVTVVLILLSAWLTTREPTLTE
jgi:spermidine/putrescine transport system permease protein